MDEPAADTIRIHSRFSVLSIRASKDLLFRFNVYVVSVAIGRRSGVPLCCALSCSTACSPRFRFQSECDVIGSTCACAPVPVAYITYSRCRCAESLDLFHRFQWLGLIGFCSMFVQARNLTKEARGDGLVFVGDAIG